MKKLIIYSIAVCSFLLMGGCSDDALDITPDGRLTLDDVFSDPIKTEAYLNRAYVYIPSYFDNYRFYAFLAGTTDDGQDSDVGNEGSNISAIWNPGSLTPSYNPITVGGAQGNDGGWDNYWTGIRDTNVFLNNIDDAPVQNESDRPRFIAEAKILRAFYYWELIKQYGPMPIVHEPFSPTFDYTSLTRPTFQTCIDSIVKDCDEAINTASLPMRITSSNEAGRFTKATAYAIKSEATLYNASPLWNEGNDASKWQAAAQSSKKALDELTAGGEYQLFPDYEEYFYSGADYNPSPRDRETIMQINEGRNFFTNAIPSETDQFKAGLTPTQELVDAYDMQATGKPAILGYNDEDHLNPIINEESGYDPENPYEGRDPRFYATVWYNGAEYDNVGGSIHIMETYIGGADQLVKTPPNRKNTRTGYYLRKYNNPKLEPTQGNQSRFKRFHLAEIYLNVAEAENEANGPTMEAYDAVNTIRARAGMPDIEPGLSKDEFRERIRDERRVELVFEEHRFWDTRRWETLGETTKLVTGMEINKQGPDDFTYKRFVTERMNAWQPKYRIFPIPISETSIIPDFNLNQNPGW